MSNQHFIEFTVPAVPVAQPRQRQRVVTAGGRTFATNYTPTNSPVNAFKATVRMAMAAAGHPPLHGPLAMHLVCVFSRPKSKCWKSRPTPRYRHAGKPDVDNVYKAVADALQGMLFNDDAQIAVATIEKWVASGDEQPHVEIMIEPLEPTCRTCGQPATCYGTYEGHTGYGCDDCCGHGCEDGHCEPLEAGT